MDPRAVAADRRRAADAAAPVHCAGLRHALLHGWQQGFPLQPSPFQVLARELGGSLREVLHHCHELGDAGALEPIHACWGASLPCVRLLGLLEPGEGPDDGPRAAFAALSRLPGVVHCGTLQPLDGGPPQALWFEIAARDPQAADVQLDALRAAGLRLSPGRVHARVIEGGADTASGPGADLALAGQCERGFPLVARPFRVLASQLGRSERALLARLRHWQRAGWLDHLSLEPPPAVRHMVCTAAVLPGPLPPASVVERLLAAPGVVDAPVLPLGPEGAALLTVFGEGAPELSAARLERVLAQAGLGARGARFWLALRTWVRPQPRLFALDD